MLKREDISTAKHIVMSLLFGKAVEDKVVVCYRRLDTRRNNVPTNNIEIEKQTNYCWERVSSSIRKNCWSWQLVMVDVQDSHKLPSHIPVWEDDEINGERSLINFARMGCNVELAQADLPLVSRLIGEPISKKQQGNGIRCWYIHRGLFIPSNKQFSRLLISVRSKVLKNKISFRELFKMDEIALAGFGLSRKEREMVNQIKTHNRRRT